MGATAASVCSVVDLGIKQSNARASSRAGYDADNRNNNIGFRLAQDIP